MNDMGMQIWELAIRESVRQTLADYTAGTDRNRITDVAACFTPDGILKISRGEPMVGPDAIVAALRMQVDRFATAAVPLTHVRHHVSSVKFGVVTRDRVEVSSYFLAVTNIGVDHWGRYRDVLVPVDGRWLFASREAVADGFSPESLMR
ncbi:nuclear transport factor 2 family protein [Mycolicibacterium stellerae]|uniref:nuclear transport factor 2 family protein n=1 Tax=Mycolicibacterium stellerae TaxID=2358193 RepID=UPI001F2BCDBA|nr:nuclear transport factor 2 family protein [Mycolicibacterium stellerae]